MKSGVPPEPPGFPEPSSETRVCESVPARRENSHQAVVERWPPADPGSRPWGHLRSAPSIRGGLTCSMGARGHSGDGAGGRAGLSMALGLTLPVFQGGCHSFTRQDAPGPGSPWERLTGGEPFSPPIDPGVLCPAGWQEVSAGGSPRAKWPAISDHVSSDPSSVVGEPVSGQTSQHGAPAAQERRPSPTGVRTVCGPPGGGGCCCLLSL